jgi:hypothetical protein
MIPAAALTLHKHYRSVTRACRLKRRQNMRPLGIIEFGQPPVG